MDSAHSGATNDKMESNMEATSHIIEDEQDPRVEIAEKARMRQVPIVVRMKFGAELYGMKVHDDGVTFCSPAPIPAGKLIELILCAGAIVVDAEIASCTPIPEDGRGFEIRARYLQPSADLRALITKELTESLAGINTQQD